MNFEIAVGDRVRTINVVRKGALLQVTLDGRTHLVDARRVTDSALSLLLQNGDEQQAVRSVDVAFTSQPPDNLDVHLLGRVIAVQARPSTHPSTRHPHASRADGSLRGGVGGSQKIVSPMPGKIVRVLVKPGDQVRAKQGLVVVEAMKMENELRAARDGRVREVPAAEGQSVEAGAVLLVVE
ncbi:MAG TPA: biotin/lipoyl-containing protein [Vicinamibacterales bacterium]|nr:biotin/lipoyl-containing protein [Vicinamibacterales bacterium]